MPPPSSPIRYLQPDEFDDPPPPFRTGSAGFVRLGPEDTLETELRLRLSANTTHALIGHGVLDEINALPLEGTLGSRLPALIRPSEIEEARTILYAADRNTYGGQWEFLVQPIEIDDPIEYRLRVQNREYQINLTRLIDVLNEASRVGEAVWIDI